MKKLSLLVNVVLLVTLSGCATIVSGSKQTVKFSSNPSAAVISINNVVVGTTPFETKLERRVKEHRVAIKLEGYKTFETTLTRKFNSWYLGNILFGGLVGIIVDPLTGAMYKISPSEVTATMEKGLVFNTEKSQIHIAVALEIDPQWEKIGQLEKL